MLENNPPRNNQLETIETMRPGTAAKPGEAMARGYFPTNGSPVRQQFTRLCEHCDCAFFHAGSGDLPHQLRSGHGERELKITLAPVSGSYPSGRPGLLLQAAALSYPSSPAAVALLAAPFTITASVIKTKNQSASLTQLGPTDWQYYGAPSTCSAGACFTARKAGGFGIIGAYATQDPDWNFYNDYPNASADLNINTTWTDADTSTGFASSGGSLNSAG